MTNYHTLSVSIRVTFSAVLISCCVATQAVKAVGSDKPFFLAAGFCRPHVPWYVPQKWFDLYPADQIETPAYRPDDMDDVPEMARRVAEVPMMPTTEWAIKTGEWNNIVQAYLACTTFADAQAGKILDALRESEYADGNRIAVTSYGVGNVSLRDRTHRYIVYEDDSEELYDMVNDPNEWTNLAGNPECAKIIARFRAHLPTNQAPLSAISTYSINEYWRAKVTRPR